MRQQRSSGSRQDIIAIGQAVRELGPPSREAPAAALAAAAVAALLPNLPCGVQAGVMQQVARP